MPDGNPKYEKLPRPESISVFTEYVSNVSLVLNVERINPQLFRVTRKNKSTLLVYLTNIYIVGEADVAEILEMNSHLNCIVTMSAWNSYTSDAKRMCRYQDIGLFVFKEFMGALYYDGKKFLDYIHSSNRE